MGHDLPRILSQASLRDFCARDTAAAGGEGWTPENPTWGHCAVVALLVQRLCRGELLRISLIGTPFETMRSHYFNRLPDRSLIDLTEEQFGGKLYPRGILASVRTRASVKSDADTSRRYNIFAARFFSAHRLRYDDL